MGSYTNTLAWWCRYFDRDEREDDWVHPVEGAFGFVMVRS